MAQTVARREERISASGPFHLSWGAIIGGTLVAVASWILLYTFGLAIGFTTVDASLGNSGALRALGWGTGIWGLITPLIALFLGGLVAARSAGLLDRTGGILHGAVVWSLTTLLTLVMAGMLLNSIIGGAVRAGSGLVGAAGSAQPAQMAQSLGLSPNDFLAPVNQRLQAQGLPTVTANQLENTFRDVAGASVRQGRFDRTLFINQLIQNTNISRSGAEEIANQVEQRWNEMRGQLGTTAQNVADTASDVGAAVFWGLFGAMLLGLISSILGGLVGAKNEERVGQRSIEGAGERRVPPTGAPPREVYP